MKISCGPLLCAILVGWAPIVDGQPAAGASASPAVQIYQAREANAGLLQQYTWNSRTEIISGAQVKDTRIDEVGYSPFGQLEHKVLNDRSAPLPAGFLRRALAEGERQQLEQYLDGLQAIIDQYTLPTAGYILDFISTAVPSSPDANGTLRLAGQGVVRLGDTFTMWVNRWTRQPSRIEVETTFQNDVVRLAATFATLPASGLNYPAFAEATVPARQLRVQVQNYDFARRGH
jgi:hypothetical protein